MESSDNSGHGKRITKIQSAVHDKHNNTCLNLWLFIAMAARSSRQILFMPSCIVP